jgi:hypothetical protein
MDVKCIFGDVQIGQDKSGNFKFSIKGLAVRRPDDTFAAFEQDSAGGHLVDVTCLLLDGAEYVYRFPVQAGQINAGDLIITQENPFYALFVIAPPDPTTGHIKGLDVRTSEVVEYVPEVTFLGSQFQFFVKVVSLLDAFGGFTGDNNLLLLLLLSQDSGNGMGSDPLTLILLLQALSGGKTLDIQALLPFLLLKGKNSDLVETLLLSQSVGGAGALTGVFGTKTKAEAKPEPKAEPKPKA